MKVGKANCESGRLHVALVSPMATIIVTIVQVEGKIVESSLYVVSAFDPGINLNLV